MSTDRTELGNRLKEYESRECSPFLPNLPVIIRIDVLFMDLAGKLRGTEEAA